MGRYLVSTRSGQPVEVTAPNWLVALGVGLDMLDAVTSIDRLACEVLANGKVIARDARSGLGVVVQAVDADEDGGIASEPVDLATADGPIVEIYDDDDSVEDGVPAPALAAPWEDTVAAAGSVGGEEEEEGDDTFALPAGAEGYGDEDEYEELEIDEDEEDETFSLSEEEMADAWREEASLFGVGVEREEGAPSSLLRDFHADPVLAPSSVGVLRPEDDDEDAIVALDEAEVTDSVEFVFDPDDRTLEEAMRQAALADVEGEGGSDSAAVSPSLASEGTLSSAVAVEAVAGGVDADLAVMLARVRACVTADAAWKTALEVAQALIPSESGAALRQEWDGTLRFVVALGPQAHKVRGERIPAGLGIVGFSVQRRMGLSIQEPARDPRFFSNIDRRTGYRTTSILAMPVQYEETLFGCLELLNAPETFTTRDMDRLGAIAQALAEQLLVAV